ACSNVEAVLLQTNMPTRLSIDARERSTKEKKSGTSRLILMASLECLFGRWCASLRDGHALWTKRESPAVTPALLARTSKNGSCVCKRPWKDSLERIDNLF